jgi:hypothetical protein
MTLVSSVNLSDEEKLDVLRRLDQFRWWHSLDEKRYCLVCREIITGREIQMIGGTRRNTQPRIICPTERCNAIPMEWVRPTDEVLIGIAMVEAERHRLSLIVRAGHAMRFQRRTTTQHDQPNKAKTETRIIPQAIDSDAWIQSTMRFLNMNDLSLSKRGIPQ